jgi:hypothetical protein
VLKSTQKPLTEKQQRWGQGRSEEVSTPLPQIVQQAQKRHDQSALRELKESCALITSHLPYAPPRVGDRGYGTSKLAPQEAPKK